MGEPVTDPIDIWMLSGSPEVKFASGSLCVISSDFGRVTPLKPKVGVLTVADGCLPKLRRFSC